MSDHPYDPGEPMPPEHRPMPPSDDPTPASSAGSRARHSRTPLLVALAAIVVAIVVGVGIGVAIAAGTDDSGSSTPKGAPPSTTVGSPASSNDQQAENGKKGKKNKGALTRGTITAVNGSTWTVKTLKGRTVKVTINAQTKFGTKKAAVPKASFTVGKKVAIVGKAGAGGTITAVRVRVPAAGGAGNKTSSSSPVPTPSSSAS